MNIYRIKMEEFVQLELDDEANYLCKMFCIFSTLSKVVSIHGFHREILKRYCYNCDSYLIHDGCP